MKKIAISLLLIQVIIVNTIGAQSDNPDFMRSVGKIYVVVAVIIAMFIGLILFLMSLERKLTKLENQITDDE